MSRVSRRSVIAVLAVAAVLTIVLSVPLQAAVFQSPTNTPVPPTMVPPPPGPSCSGFFYRVLPGDTLSRIAARFGVSLSSLIACNGIANPNRIFAGQLLVIPKGGVPVPPPPPFPGTCTTYVVRSGDTLSSIARRFGTTVFALASANGISNPNVIFAGQVLKVNCGGHVPPPPGPGFYRVVAGDTVSSIAARFHESVWEIIAANGLHFPYTIYVGQLLRIP